MSKLIQIGLSRKDGISHYRREEIMDDLLHDRSARSIASRVQYPRRLLAGLDNISREAFEQYLTERKIIILGLRLTNVCNYDCVYCGTAEQRGRDSDRVLKTAEYLDLIDQGAELGARTILFGANGEPLMTPDLLTIVERVADRGMTPLLFTNASLFGNDALCQKWHGVTGLELLQRLDRAGTSLMISCESLNRDRYNKIMRVNAFDYFWRGIDRIRSESSFADARTFEGRPLCRLGLSVVMMPENYEERHALVDFIHALNGLAILKVPSLHGSARDNQHLMFSVERAAEIKSELAELSDKDATLQILNLACASWTMGMSIDNEGHFMACMTEEVSPFEAEQNARNTRLRDLLGRRLELVKLGTTVCPVKDKFYKPPVGDGAAS